MDGDPDLLEALACIYREQGYSTNASGYSVLAESARAAKTGKFDGSKLVAPVLSRALAAGRSASNRPQTDPLRRQERFLFESGVLSTALFGEPGLQALKEYIQNKGSLPHFQGDVGDSSWLRNLQNMTFAEAGALGSLGNAFLKDVLKIQAPATPDPFDTDKLALTHASALRYLKAPDAELAALCSQHFTGASARDQAVLDSEALLCLLRAGQPGKQEFKRLMNALTEPTSLHSHIFRLFESKRLGPDEWAMLEPYITDDIVQYDWMDRDEVYDLAYPASLNYLMRHLQRQDLTEQGRQNLMDSLASLVFSQPDAFTTVMRSGNDELRRKVCSTEIDRRVRADLFPGTGIEVLFSKKALLRMNDHTKACASDPSEVVRADFLGSWVNFSQLWKHTDPNDISIVEQALTNNPSPLVLNSILRVLWPSCKPQGAFMTPAILKVVRSASREHDPDIKEYAKRCLRRLKQ